MTGLSGQDSEATLADLNRVCLSFSLRDPQ